VDVGRSDGGLEVQARVGTGAAAAAAALLYGEVVVGGPVGSNTGLHSPQEEEVRVDTGAGCLNCCVDSLDFLCCLCCCRYCHYHCHYH